MFQLKKYIVLIIVCCMGNWVNAQDVHYSYYQFTPVDVNPAMSGAFNGSYRLNGVYSQKEIAATNGHHFYTYSLSADAPIIRGLRKQDWIGVGFHADISQTGHIPEELVGAGRDNIQSLMFLKVAAAYHLALNKKQTRIFTLGLQMTNSNRNIAFLNPGGMTRVGMMFAGPDPDLNAFNGLKGQGGGGGGANQSQNIRYGYRDFRTGLLYNERGKKTDLKLGVAFNGLFRPYVGTSALIPRRSFTRPDQGGPPPKDSVETRYFGLNLHGELKYKINEKFSVVPSFFYYSLGPANAFNVNAHAWYQIDPEKDFKAGFGLGTRSMRDILFFFGAEFGDYRAGIAYDMPVSDKTIATGLVGGFELCVSYMGKIYKKPKVKPVVFCPRL